MIKSSYSKILELSLRACLAGVAIARFHKCVRTFYFFFNNISLILKKFFALKILGKKYIREGKCNNCGRCCQGIFVRHSSNFIKDEEEFERLKTQHFFYTYLKVVDKNEIGLLFECTKHDKETGLCTAYNKRALLCKKYPQEEIFMLGGELYDGCGYSFAPIISFDDVFKKVVKRAR